VAISWRALSFLMLSLLLSLPAEAVGRQGAVLHGRVTDAAGEPVAGALIELIPVGAGLVRRSAVTADIGSYRLDDVAAGAYHLQVQRIGFATYATEVRLSPGEVRRLDVTLVVAAVAIDSLVIEGERTAARERSRFEAEAGTTARVVTSQELKRLPGLAEPDVLRAIVVLPGVVTTSDFSSAFNVRGGAADQNLILLDGFPVFNPFHLGGLFSVFNADVLGGAELLAGGFGAEYGGRVSSVLNVETKEFIGSEFGGAAGVSLLASRLSLHGGLPFASHRGGWFVSARRSYFDRILPDDVGLPYHLIDLQGGLTFDLPRGGRLRIVAYTGDDVFDMSRRESRRSDDDSNAPIRIKWIWGNDVLGVRWDQPWGEWITTARLGGSRYTEKFGMIDFDGVSYSSRLRQLFGRVDLVRGFATGSVRFGGEVSGLEARNHFGGGGTSLWDEGARGTMAGTFAQVGWRPTESWLIEPSVRVDLWSAADTSHLLVSPRFAVKRFLGAGRDAAIKLAVGRYTQFLHSLKDETLPLSNDMWVLAGAVLPAVASDQVQLGVERYWGERWSASLEAYHREFRGLVAFNSADDTNDPNDDYLTGTGRSYGLDLMVRKRSGRWTGWTTVSFLKAERTFADPLALGWEGEPPTITYPPGYDRRVDIDLVLQFAGPKDLELGLRWNFGTGLPYTRPIAQSIMWEYDPVIGRHTIPVPTGGEEPDGPPMYVILGPRNGERYPAYHRLDISVRKTVERRWGSYTPYLQVLNAYNRKNPLFYFYHYDRSPATVSGLSMFPILPTIGLEVTF